MRAHRFQTPQLITLQSAARHDLLAEFDPTDGHLLRIRKRNGTEPVSGWYAQLGGQYLVVAPISSVELRCWVGGAPVDFEDAQISAWGPLFSRVLRISAGDFETELEYSIDRTQQSSRPADDPRDFGAFLARLSTDRDRRARLAQRLFPDAPTNPAAANAPISFRRRSMSA